MAREKVLENHTLPFSALGPVILDQTEKVYQVEILRDVHPDEIEPRCPAAVQSYMEEKRNRFQASYSLLERHRMLNMSRAEKNYNRRIKKTSYDLGDLVLVCHPNLKKGLSTGLAPRYYGPFKVVGRYEIGCDYLIKSVGQSKSKVKQIHVNNLKTYFERGQSTKLSRQSIKLEIKSDNASDEDQFPTATRRKVLKKML